MKTMRQRVNSFLSGTRPADQQSKGPIDGGQRSDLRLKFHKASLRTVLKYLRESAGLIIHVSSNVPIEPSLDLWCDEPVSTADALLLLKQVLIEKDCALISKGPLFSIIRSQDVKKNCIPLPELR
jgi:hypothetical protein